MMVIPFGSKIVRRKRGYVADFCPICRTPQVFRLLRVISVGHIAYVTVGLGTVMDHERACLACRTAVRADPGFYASVSRARRPLAELMARTFPNDAGAVASLGAQLALAARIKQDPASLSAEERQALIRHPFLLLGPKVDEHFSRTGVDGPVMLAIVAAFALLVFLPEIAMKVTASTDAQPWLFISCALGLALVAWQLVESGRRFMRREVLSALELALRPLRPTDGELDAVLRELRKVHPVLAHKVDAANLQARLRPTMSNLGQP